MDSRESYLEELEARERALDEDIKVLQAQAEKLDRSTLRRLHKKIEELEEHRREVRARMAGLRTGAAWEDLKHGVEQAWQDLTKAFEDAREEFRKSEE